MTTKESIVLYSLTVLIQKKAQLCSYYYEPDRRQLFPSYVHHGECLQNPHPEDNKKSEMIRTWANQYDLTLNELDVKSTDDFHDLELYFNYLIGVL